MSLESDTGKEPGWAFKERNKKKERKKDRKKERKKKSKKRK